MRITAREPVNGLTILELQMAKVGYYDMSRGAGNPRQVDGIRAAGDEANNVKVPDAETLAGLDVLVVQNPSNNGYGSEGPGGIVNDQSLDHYLGGRSQISKILQAYTANRIEFATEPELSAIVGTPDEDVLTGTERNDLIESGLGDDVVYGNTGSDNLDGGKGDDWIRGKEGADTINGGNGADTLFWCRKDVVDADGNHNGVDVIKDFDAGADKLDFTDLIKATKFDNISEVVILGESGVGAVVSVYAGSVAGVQQVAVLDDILGLDVETLYHSGAILA